MIKENNPKKGVPAPIAAIIIIAMVWLGSQTSSWFSKDDEVVNDDSSTQTAPDLSEGIEWLTYHGGTALTGEVDMDLPDSPEVLWRYQANSGVLFPPVADESTIYFAAVKGDIIAVDLLGQEQWKHRYLQEPYVDGRERTERFDAPMALFQDRVYAGTMSGLLYSFDKVTGETTWTYDVGGAVLGSVNFHGYGDEAQVFIVEQGEGALHSLRYADGELLWDTEGVERCDGSPSVRDGQIVYGSCAAALHVISIDEKKHIKDITFDEESQVAGGVAIVGDSAFSGSYSGRVFRVNLSTGDVVWTNEDSEDEIFTTPAVDDNWVIVSSFDGFVYGLDKATGEKKWAFDSLGTPKSPVIAQDKVVVTSDGLLYILSLETGEELWSYEVSDEISAPALYHNMIVVGSEDGSVTAFGYKGE